MNNQKVSTGLTTVSRSELVGNISLPSTNTAATLNNGGGLLPADRWYKGIWLTFSGRMTNPAANGPTGVLADAPFSLIQNIQVSGYHRLRGSNEVFINMRGVDLYNLNRIYSMSVPAMEPASTGYPSFTPSLSVAANATNDIRFSIYIPFTPLNIPVDNQFGYMLDAPNYDRLTLTVQFADAKSVFTGQTTQPTFTAYGATTGSPSINVTGEFVLGGNTLLGFVPARTWRYFQEVTTGDIITMASSSRLYNLPRGNYIRGVMVKTGVKASTVTGGNDAYTSYSDTILNTIQLFRGTNRVIRSYVDFKTIKEQNQFDNGMYPQTGHGMIDFVRNWSLGESLDTTGLVAGATGDVDVYIQSNIVGAASTAALFAVEELRGKPYRISK